ncbi:MAG: type IX secretion system membrane protein PorP/SprF [Fulvivirga sp.]
MKFKITLSVLLILQIVGYQALGQQTEYTQYFTNLPATNPGFTGINDFLDVKAGIRQGWNDFDNQNVSGFISAYGTLNKPLKEMVRSNSLRLSDPALIKHVSNNPKLRRKHGIGGAMSFRNLGPYKQTSIMLNYAYHLPVSKKINWTMGARVGYMFQQIDFTNYTVRDEINDTFYQQLISSASGRESKIIVDFGTVLYTDRFYIGLSTNNIINSELSSDDLLENEVFSNYQLQLGKNFTLSPVVEMNTNLAVNYYESIDPGIMASTRILIKDIVYIGAGYEYERKISMLFGLVSNGKYAIHYSYDKYTSELSDFNVNSHEVVVGIFIFNKYNLKTKFW